MTPVEMPKANENLTEATLNTWLVKEGDRVEKDGALCEIITDKATFPMPAPCAGIVLKTLAPERSVLPVGYVMCVLGEASETVPSDLAAKNEALLYASSRDDGGNERGAPHSPRLPPRRSRAPEFAPHPRPGAWRKKPASSWRRLRRSTV